MTFSETLTLIGRSLPTLLQGAGITMALISTCLGLGILGGIPLAFVHVYGACWSKFAAGIYDRVFRGFPALVLLFLFYFGLGSIKGFSISPFIAVVLALGLRSVAYQAQIYRGGLLAVGEDQMDAARSLGMTKLQAIWFVILPQALYFSLPGIANEYSIVLKDTALAFAVGVVELFTRGKFIAVHTRATLSIYLTVAVIYLFLTYIGIFGFWVVERLAYIPGLGGRTREGER
ncbi:MAG: amino acid ABC transporter permease [Candidatus Bipolaricaulota bacterium]|nr:amino acid ABC transporter permease [Candidatus Bipolaricaulota bacterium]